MLSEALAFPRRDDGWLETMLIGGVLTLVGFLIIPVILVNGYSLRVMRAAVHGEETPPRFGDWVDLFVDGLLVWVVEVVYVGVPTFLLAVLVGSFTVIASVSTSAGAGPAPRTAFGAGAFVAVLVLLVLVLLMLLAAYLLPAALANFARTGDVAAAFHLRTVAGAALSVDYLVAVLLAIGVAIVLGTVGGLLLVVLVGVFVLFYLQVVVYYLFGRGFASALDLDSTAGEGSGAAP